MNYPKLRYPIATKGLQHEDELILLAYDCVYRLLNASADLLDGNPANADLKHDAKANLANLGYHIENMICGGDMSLRFEGYDSAAATKAKWQKITEEELNKTNSQI